MSRSCNSRKACPIGMRWMRWERALTGNYLLGLDLGDPGFNYSILSRQPTCPDRGPSQLLALPDRIECLGRALTATQLAALLAVSRIIIYRLAKKNRRGSYAGSDRTGHSSQRPPRLYFAQGRDRVSVTRVSGSKLGCGYMKCAVPWVTERNPMRLL